MRKPVIWLSVSAVIGVMALTFAFFIEKVTVLATETALTESGWQVYFSEPLANDSVEAGHLYVTDQHGKKMQPEFELLAGNKKLQVTGLKPGTYTLHMNKKAVSGNFYKVMETEKIEFTVYDEIESIRSNEDLLTYFKRAKDQITFLRADMGFAESEEASDTSAESSKESSKVASDGDYSTTNVQVEGIDESDIVKTDGRFVYSVFGENAVEVLDIQDPQSMKVASRIKMDTNYYPSQLFLHDNVLIVIGSKSDVITEDKAQAKQFAPSTSFTTVRFYNVSNPQQPEFIREVGAEGYLNSARKTENMLYVVTNVHPHFWALDELEEDALRPKVFDSSNEEDTSYMNFDDISILPGATEPSYSVITAIDVSSPESSQLETKGFLGSSEQLYMTKDHLYLTATTYDVEQSNKASRTTIWNPANVQTEFFKFKLNGSKVDYFSHAALKGRILNQFSMDEHEGHFRVVMTEGNMWDDSNPSKNHLYILDESMELTGSVEGLAKGERIYSARFMGDKAYMVTFRETDPLFVIDVADPSKPEVLGELKIPGFSNYLHPLDENHLIGFGYDTVAKKNPSGGEPLIITKGMKISLFDVSDFHNPKEKFTEIIGGQGTYSPIQYDHKALFQHKNRSLYGFPVSVYEETSKEFELDYKGSGALIYEITPEKGIVLKGDLVKGLAKGQQYEEWEKQVERIIYSGDNLFTVAREEIISYDLKDFEEISKLQTKQR